MTTALQFPGALPRWRRWSLRRRDEAADTILNSLGGLDEPTGPRLLSVEQLRRHAQAVARSHHVTNRPGRDRLTAQLQRNSRLLEKTYRLLSRDAAEGRDLAPAAVWLLDNYYLLREQIRATRRQLARKHSRELPQLATGDNTGLPRIYDIALELVSHVDGRIDRKGLQQFLAAYQEITHLTVGELWAVPMMVRLALMENVCLVGLRMVWRRQRRLSGEAWAERLLRASRTSLAEFFHTLGALVTADPSLNSAFVARFTQRLDGHLPKDNIALEWLAQQLAQREQTVEGLRDLDSRHEAADEISMGNAISSLRALGDFNWKEIVEELSIVEQVLQHDPAATYARMDFESRDRYRRAVERLARHSNLDQEQVALAAVEHARNAAVDDTDDARRRHVGYYLVDRGRALLEESINYRPSWWEHLTGSMVRAPLGVYLGAILLTWLATVLGASVGAWELGIARATGPGIAILLLVLFAGAAGQFAVSLVNWLTTLFAKPRPIMRLDFSEGIPADCRTLVAVPTMLTGKRAVQKLVEQLEIRYLANQDENLVFALVTDFPDAEHETMPTDHALLAMVRQGIEDLNAKYCDGRPPVFYFYHRPRKYNPQEGVWMGEERKRGKLAAMNRILRTGASDDFTVTVGDLSRLRSVRYVITLDTDTMLPRDVARDLVGCMAHPLNHPRIDPETGLVVEGHAVLQPRVAPTISEAIRSRFSRLFSEDAGIDPYTGQTSDVYQDVFGQGSFIGKGIYDVEAFETTLEGRFPDNRVLSHDLIEGVFARSGLVSDLQLFEGFPSTFLADMSRRHRWIRGDWQIAAWLGSHVPSAQGLARNPLSALSRWKIFDNLRRSVTPILLVAFLVLAWTLAGGLAVYWTSLALLLVFGPAAAMCLAGLPSKPERTPWSLHLHQQAGNCFRAFCREAIGLCVLPYVAHCNLDAIVRTLYRLHVSRKKLLEWTTSSDAEVRSQGGCRDHYEVMWACPIAALSMAAVLWILHPMALPAASPVLLAWLLGPAVAWLGSRRSAVGTVVLDADRARQMRRWARHTWHYFDTHVNPETNWLAPDNVQEKPAWTVAHRTSPTNIGMGLLAHLAAYDLGYLAAGELLERTQRTLQTMSRLDRYRGHFYNWYDTRTLEACEPRYVSTVDSGNLWGALIVLREGLQELRDRPLYSSRLIEGVTDTLEVIATLARQIEADASRDEFETRLAAIRQQCVGRCEGARDAWKMLRSLEQGAAELAAAVPSGAAALEEWCQAFMRGCTGARQELRRLAFWVEVDALDPSAHPALAMLEPEIVELREHLARLDRQCTLRQLPEAAQQAAARASALLSSMEALNGDAPLHALRRQLSSMARSAEESVASAREELCRVDALAELCDDFSRMEFGFLLNPERRLLAIGYNASEHRRDNSHYDLLASEARLTSFLGISAGQLPREHWFALGRMMTRAGGKPALLSWSGSMFEYLMPMLLMPSRPSTLLDSSCRAVLRHQIRYGRRRNVPWGISESSYSLLDPSASYCYRAFGVPGLGLQRGLGDDLVVAPYASAMGVMLGAREACDNLARLEQQGCLSRYGFYDAVDFTPERCPAARQPEPCRTVMAHHSGMTLLAFAHVLLDQPMQRRFLADPRCRAHDLLLEERLPQAVRLADLRALDKDPAAALLKLWRAGRAVAESDAAPTVTPEAHLLGNGRYYVVLARSGSSLSRWSMTPAWRFRDLSNHEQFRQMCRLRDLESGTSWSSTSPPKHPPAGEQPVTFSPGWARYRVLYEAIEVQTQVGVSPEDDVEVRRLRITNLSGVPREIELTTDAEVLLPEAESGPEMEVLYDGEAILGTRAPRSPDDQPPSWFHLLHVGTSPAAPPGAETNRLRRTLLLDVEESIVVYLITGVARSKREAQETLARYRDPRLAERALDVARAYGASVARHQDPADADVFHHASLAAARPHLSEAPGLQEEQDDSLALHPQPATPQPAPMESE